MSMEIFKKNVETLRDRRDELLAEREDEAKEIIETIGGLAGDCDNDLAELRINRVREAVDSVAQLVAEIGWEEIDYAATVRLPGDPPVSSAISDASRWPNFPRLSTADLPDDPDRDDEEFEDDDEWFEAVEEARQDRERLTADHVRAVLEFLGDEMLPRQLTEAMEGRPIDTTAVEKLIVELRSAVELWFGNSGTPPSWVDPNDYL